MSSRGKYGCPQHLRLTFEYKDTNDEEAKLDHSSPATIFMQTQMSSQLSPPSSQPFPFEFARKKRWADLLITEMAEVILLILSTQCQILYCSAAVRELLGWRDEDLIDTGFIDLVNGA